LGWGEVGWGMGGARRGGVGRGGKRKTLPTARRHIATFFHTVAGLPCGRRLMRYRKNVFHMRMLFASGATLLTWTRTSEKAHGSFQTGPEFDSIWICENKSAETPTHTTFDPTPHSSHRTPPHPTPPHMCCLACVFTRVLAVMCVARWRGKGKRGKARLLGRWQGRHMQGKARLLGRWQGRHGKIRREIDRTKKAPQPPFPPPTPQAPRIGLGWGWARTRGNQANHIAYYLAQRMANAINCGQILAQSRAQSKARRADSEAGFNASVKQRCSG
jgi:hypothetical protein